MLVILVHVYFPIQLHDGIDVNHAVMLWVHIVDTGDHWDVQEHCLFREFLRGVHFDSSGFLAISWEDDHVNFEPFGGYLR